MKKRIITLFLCLLTLTVAICLFTACGDKGKNIDGIILKLNDDETSYYVEKYDGTSTTVNIPSTYNGKPVTSIDEAAFYNYTMLTTLTIPESITSICDKAFFGCSELTNITIPNNVISIGDYAFSNCTKLTSITIPNNVICIGNSAFFRCTKLTSVTIGTSVTSIGFDAFSTCTELTSINLPNSVVSMGKGVFSDCTKLSTLTFENTSAWYCTENLDEWQNKTGGINIDVTDALTNAKYFKLTYDNYFWYKK